MANQPIMDLSERSVALAGQAFSNVYDLLNREHTRDHHIAGILLIQELHRVGLSLTRPRPLRLLVPTLPVVNAHMQALSLWDDPDLEATVELPHLIEGGV